jgi:hypothetical protein
MHHTKASIGAKIIELDAKLESNIPERVKGQVRATRNVWQGRLELREKELQEADQSGEPEAYPDEHKTHSRRRKK